MKISHVSELKALKILVGIYSIWRFFIAINSNPFASFSTFFLSVDLSAVRNPWRKNNDVKI